MADLPDRVLDQRRRPVEPGRLVAAWGQDPITLSCGVPVPAGTVEDTRCFEVNGVGWYAQEGTGGWLFSTVGRPAVVQVGVPSAYAPEANALVDLADAIHRHDPVLQPCL